MSSAPTVGIAGITGKFARCLVRNLLRRSPTLSIRGFCRSPDKLPTAISSSSRIQVIQGAADDVAAARSFARGCDVVICCYLGDNTLMFDGQKVLVDACAAEEVPRYVASDWTLDYTQLQRGQLYPKDPTLDLKTYLDGKEGVKGVHVLVGAFFDTWFSPYFMVWDEKEVALRFWGDGDEVWEGTSYENAAAYTAAVALDESAVGLQRFLGDRKNIRQIAQSFEAVYGVKPRLERRGSLDELFKHMHEVRAQYPDDKYRSMAMFYQYYLTNGKTYIGEHLDNSKYPGITPVTFEDFMRSHSMEILSGTMDAAGSDF